MKKNLRNILALSLGLMTTVVCAQDWNADSRTRANMHGENDMMITEQRATIGATWGGSNWGIHVSSDVNYILGDEAFVGRASMNIYEAHASADLNGLASMTAGRQALNYGSGALISSNDWAANRTTWDGLTFGLNLDMADVTVGYASANLGDVNDEDNGSMHVNIAGEFSGWNVNLLWVNETIDGEDNGDAATGIDISGNVAGAGVHASLNSDHEGDEMRVLGLTYAVNDDMGIHASQTTYSEDGNFNMAGTDMDGSWMTTGNLGYQSAGDEVLSYGLTYNMGGISLGATMHAVTNDDAENDEYNATEISLGYSLNDNASLSLSMVNTDWDVSGVEGDFDMMWLTLNIGL